MEQDKTQQEPIIKVGGESFSLHESQTGEFGITKAELQMILLMLLKKNKNGRSPQRVLFDRLLSHMKIRPTSDRREDLLKIYMENLRELKNSGKVEFISGKIRTHVRLINQ